MTIEKYKTFLGFEIPSTSQEITGKYSETIDDTQLVDYFIETRYDKIFNISPTEPDTIEVIERRKRVHEQSHRLMFSATYVGREINTPQVSTHLHCGSAISIRTKFRFRE